MPVIGKIKNIVLRMFFDDHAPPHFHADNTKENGLFSIKTLAMFKGNLSVKDQNEVQNWAQGKQDKLLEMWETQKITKID